MKGLSFVARCVAAGLALLGLAGTGAAQPPTPDRITIRVVDGRAGFYNAVTGVRFVPRGVNYIDFSADETGSYGDLFLSPDRFDAERIRAAFQILRSYDYNTVRIFLDHCGSGVACIVRSTGQGLNPDYLDNIARVMQIAAEEGVYLILTSNDLPDAGGYAEINARDVSAGFYGYRNVTFLTASGLEAASRYWDDLLTGLAERGVPWSVMLGWSLVNEQWLFADQPPLSLTQGEVTISSGRTYDLADRAQKREMVVDGLVHYMTTLRDVIRGHDPDALVTMGFFVPRFPNDTAIGAGWFVDTAPLLERAPLDFFDFHAYPASDISLAQIAGNFGMLGYEDKPIIMGEVGAFRDRFPSVELAARRVQDWIAESCQYGFDGWLYWEYYGQDVAGDRMYGLAGDNALLLFTLSPLVQPDPCATMEIYISNVAFEQAASATRSLPDAPPERAVDGTGEPWISGADAPQGIEVTFDQPRRLSQIRLTVAQDPAGDTAHRVWAVRADGSRVLLAVLDGRTQDGQVIDIGLPAPLPDVMALEVVTLASPSWVAWREVEAFEGNTTSEACVGALDHESAVYDQPGGRGSRPGRALDPGTSFVATAAIPAEETIWYSLPGGNAFVPQDGVTLSGACAELPDALGPATVPVTFMVRAPASTEGSVYLAGDFGAGYPVWDPAGLPAQSPLGSLAWVVRLQLPPGAVVEYKYTRGSWETVEKGEDCAEIPNRTLTVGTEPMTVRDLVANWREAGLCDG